MGLLTLVCVSVSDLVAASAHSAQLTQLKHHWDCILKYMKQWQFGMGHFGFSNTCFQSRCLAKQKHRTVSMCIAQNASF